MIVKKNTFNIFLTFLFIHMMVWTLLPTFLNVNLPLDTIEALAWGSNLDWGFNKHPPLSAFAVEIFYQVFGNQDWAYYFLSQIFVIVAFFSIYKFSEDFFKNRNLAFFSVILLEGIYFYNFTTPEFNVNVCQLPFWTLSIYFTWRCIKYDNSRDYFFLGLLVGLGILSKYLFIYLAIGIKILFIYLIKKGKKIKFKNYFIAGPIAILILLPHMLWLSENNYSTIVYGFERAGGIGNISDHLIYPLVFLSKQLGILIPFFLMVFFLVKKFKFKINFKDERIVFLIFTTLLPILLILSTSMIMGAKIRTMWMTPFYLFLGVLFIEIFKKNILKRNFEKFYTIFLFFFILAPVLYLGASLTSENKRTAYPGKEIARLVENKWEKNFTNEIKIVIGDEWFAGNLSYHLNSRPTWIKSLNEKKSKIELTGGVIYAGNPTILKKVCPGVFGTIKPVGYCMIGKK